MGATVTKSVRATPELWAAVEAAAGARGVKVNAFIVAALESATGDEPKAAPASRPAPPPKGPVPAMELAASAPRGRSVVVKETPRQVAAREALAQAEAGARHLATPKGGKVDMRAAMEKVGLMDYGTRPKTYGDRLKGVKPGKRR